MKEKRDLSRNKTSTYPLWLASVATYKDGIVICLDGTRNIGGVAGTILFMQVFFVFCFIMMTIADYLDKATRSTY